MKQILDGYTYDTDTSRRIAHRQGGDGEGSHDFAVTLYQTEAGRYFMLKECYVTEDDEGLPVWGSYIEPFTSADAERWLIAVGHRARLKNDWSKNRKRSVKSRANPILGNRFYWRPIMKKVINGLVYDTETATRIACKESGTGSGFHDFSNELYRTRSGRFFAAESGYNSDDGYGGTVWGTHIVPLTEAETANWVENNGVDPDAVAEHIRFQSA